MMALQHLIQTLPCLILLFICCDTQSIHLVTVNENEANVFLFEVTFELTAGCEFKEIVPTSTTNIQLNFTTPWTVSGNKYAVNMTLASPLDREVVSSVNVFLSVIYYCSGVENKNSLGQWLIMVGDEFDTPPHFQQGFYQAVVKENTEVNTIIVANITARDADTNDMVQYEFLEDNALFAPVTSFKILSDGFSWNVLDIILTQSLDFETTTLYRFIVLAKDKGNLSSSCEVTISVQDVQDTPPAFSLRTYSGRVNESAPVGTSVTSVTATDGDSIGIRNQVKYTVIDGPTNYFGVNIETGEVFTKNVLDIDGENPIGTNGFVSLTIQAEERNTSGEVQYGHITATTNVQIQIEDSNDHPPMFSASTYSGSIRADAVVGELVSLEGGGYISVTDKDLTPSNNHFRLHIEQNGVSMTMFDTNIRDQYVQASVLIVLKEPESLKQLENTHINIQIVAEDFAGNSILSTNNTSKSVASIAIFVLPQATAVPPPQPIIDLPITTSDVIVFVIGVLLLLNIIFTIIICRLMCRNGQEGLGTFGRNSKYYVSGRKKDERTNAAQRLDEIPTKTVDGGEQEKTIEQIAGPSLFTSPNESTETPSTGPVTNENTEIKGRITPLVKKDRCDVVHLNEILDGKTESRNNAKTSDETAKKSVSLLNRTDIPPQRASTSYQTSVCAPTLYRRTTDNPRNENKCDLAPLETTVASTSKALSNLLDRVHQKLAPANKGKADACDLRPLKEETTSLESSVSNSNNSSFSEKLNNNNKCDVAPFTTSALTTTPQSKMLYSSQVNPAFVKDEELKSKPQPLHKEGNQLPTVNRSKQKPSVPQIIPSLQPNQSQITQTGVPPIALALPIGSGTSVRNEDTMAATVTNPVYREDTTTRQPKHTPTEKAGQTFPKTVEGNTRQQIGNLNRKPAPAPSTSINTDTAVTDYVTAAKLLLHAKSQNV